MAIKDIKLSEVPEDVTEDGVKDEQTQHYLVGLQHKKMLMPEKFAPDIDLLAQHYESYLKSVV